MVWSACSWKDSYCCTMNNRWDFYPLFFSPFKQKYQHLLIFKRQHRVFTPIPPFLATQKPLCLYHTSFLFLLTLHMALNESEV